MSHYFKLSLISVMLFSVTACKTVADWVEGEDNMAEPTALTEIEAEKTVVAQRQLQATTAAITHFTDLNLAQQGDLSIIADSKGVITAINRSSGEVAWRTAVDIRVSSGPTVGQNTVIVASQAGDVIALNAQTGAELWRTQVNQEVLAKTAIDQRHVIVKTVDDKVHALSLKTGEILWEYKHGTAGISLRGSSAPVIAGQYVVVGFADGRLDVIELATGTLIWQRPIAFASGASLVERIVGILADPIVDHGVVYVATYQGKLAAIEISTGRDLWQLDMSVYAGMVLAGDALYVTDANSQIWAVHKRSGQVLWRQNNLAARSLSAPVVMDDSLVVIDRFGFVHFLAKDDGRFVARTQLSEAVAGRPLVEGQHLHVLNRSGHLTQLAVNA